MRKTTIMCVLLGLVLLSVLPAAFAFAMYQPKKYMDESPIVHQYPYMNCGYKTLSVNRNIQHDYTKWTVSNCGVSPYSPQWTAYSCYRTSCIC